MRNCDSVEDACATLVTSIANSLSLDWPWRVPLFSSFLSPHYLYSSFSQPDKNELIRAAVDTEEKVVQWLWLCLLSLSQCMSMSGAHRKWCAKTSYLFFMLSAPLLCEKENLYNLLKQSWWTGFQTIIGPFSNGDAIALLTLSEHPPTSKEHIIYIITYKAFNIWYPKLFFSVVPVD